MKKSFGIIFILIMMSLVLVSCKKNVNLDTKTEGELTIMLYNGSGNDYDDIGKKTLSAEEIPNDKVNLIYGVAKEFNKTYPNIKINLHVKNGDSYNWDTKETWAQYRENYELQNNRKVDIWDVTDLAGDTQRGLVADLSIYKNDQMYKQMNPALMDMLNYYGVQAGLPKSIFAWGVFVNKTLAEQKNIDVPSPNWTLEEYTDFVSHSKKDDFYGGSDFPRSFVFTGASSIAQQLAKQGKGQDYINVNSQEVRDLIPYFNRWAQHTGWDQYDSGGMSPEFMNDHGWYWINFFNRNALLTHIGDPWSLSAVSAPDKPLMVENADWDYYPRPSTSKVDNHTGIVLDPIAVRNYAMDDGNAELSKEEKAKLDIAYTFASYWVASTDSWKVKSEQFYKKGDLLVNAINDSLPITTGKAFDEQMDIWFEADSHKHFASKDKTPGFHKILELFKSGKIYDVADKAYPWNFDDAGNSKQIIHEWNQMTNPAELTGVVGATSPKVTESGFTDAVLAKLPEWNTLFNQRFDNAFKELQTALMKYYNKTDKDFN